VTYFQLSPVFYESYSPRSTRSPVQLLPPLLGISYKISKVSKCVVKMQSSLFFKQMVHIITTVDNVDQADVLIRVLFMGFNKNSLR
jgi:hypothetical protein